MNVARLVHPCFCSVKRSHFELFIPEVYQWDFVPPYLWFWSNFKCENLTVPDLKSNCSLLHLTVWSPSCRTEISRTGRLGVWGVKVSWFTGSKLPSPLLPETGQGWGKCLAGLLPTAHCYPAHEGSHCCASSLSLTTSVNKDLNNKQRNASLCVTVSFTGLSFSSSLATLMTRSKGARNGRLISFLWHH